MFKGIMPAGTDVSLLEVKKSKKDFFYLKEQYVIYGLNPASRLPVFVSARNQSYARLYLKWGAHFSQTLSFI